MFVLDPAPSLLLNGILFSTWVTVWKQFQQRIFLTLIGYNYLVKVIDNRVALHKAIWLSAMPCFPGVPGPSLLQVEACTGPLKGQEYRLTVGRGRFPCHFPMLLMLCLLI